MPDDKSLTHEAVFADVFSRIRRLRDCGLPLGPAPLEAARSLQEHTLKLMLAIHAWSEGADPTNSQQVVLPLPRVIHYAPNSGRPVLFVEAVRIPSPSS